MRVEKITLGNLVSEMVESSTYLYWITYKGLTVKEFTSLRDKLAAAGATCHVLKNTLIRLALKNNGIQMPASMKLEGDTAMVFGEADPVPVAKILKEFVKEAAEVTVKGGLVEGRVLNAAAVEALAEMPPKEVIFSQIVGLIKAPAAAVHRPIASRKDSIVRLLEAFVQKQETAE